jgi:hypothetical protein
MKKLILSLAALGALTLVSCSEENKIPVIAYTGCQVCEVAGVNPDRPEDYEVCVAPTTVGEGDEAETVDIIYVNGGNTGLTPTEYFSLYCDNTYTPGGTGGGTGGGGTTEPGTPTTNCVTCAAFTQAGVNVPATQVCKGSNGHAFVQNVDMQVNYEDYLTAQRQFTTCN